MENFMRNILTGVDNQTHDIGRVFAAVTGASGIFFQGWSVIVQHAPFSMQDFGVGVGALAAGVGAMLKFKENTEPKK